MTTKPFNLHFGDFAGICQVHFGNAMRFGMLVDPNGHSWLICEDCIKALWEEKQAINQEPTDEEIEERLDTMLVTLGELIKRRRPVT